MSYCSSSAKRAAFRTATATLLFYSMVSMLVQSRSQQTKFLPRADYIRVADRNETNEILKTININIKIDIFIVKQVRAFKKAYLV